MRIESFGLSPEHAEAVVRGCAQGRYALLTGAGFSLGAKTTIDKIPTAPTTADLAKHIAERFRLAFKPQTASDLAVAYEDAVYEEKSAEPVVAYLRRILTSLTPTWHSITASIPWRRVWTLNIDDLPDGIWQGRQRPLTSIVFNEPYRSIHHENDELQVIYLHGRLAARSIADVKLIFSIPEYAQNTASPQSWHEAFLSEFSDQPFIICGASVAGEMDLARTFRSGNQSLASKGFPSLAVVYGIDEAARKRFRDRFNLLPIDTTGKEFFEALAKDVEEYLEAHPQAVASSAAASDARLLGSQFSLLTDTALNRSSEMFRHDFYAGDEPNWSDILQTLDANTLASRLATDHVKRAWNGGKDGALVILTGAPGCGKTTTLLRTLRNLASFTPSIYLFRGEERLDAAAIARCMRQGTPAVFGFDLAADFSVDINDLIKALRSRQIRFAIIAADRDRRIKALKNDLRETESETIDQSIATNQDAIELYSVRKLHHRLGAYTALDKREFRKLVTQKHEGNIFSAMAEVEGGHGFERRLDDVVAANVVSAEVSALAIAISLTHRWGYPLPLRTASIASGLDPGQLVRLCQDAGALSDIFSVDSKGIRFRHRILANHFFQKSKNLAERKLALISIISSLGPLVSVDSIKSRSYPYLICRALMDRRAVIESVGGVDEARSFFASVEPTMGGNSRFWEQRALLESEAGDHPKAYSYAHEAISRERHTFPLTTLGRVCMAQAVSIGNAAAETALDRFKEGNSALMEAKSIARRSEVIGHPFTCFFEYAIKFYNTAAKSSRGAQYLSETWSEWMLEARRINAIPGDQAQRFDGKWLKLEINSER